VSIQKENLQRLYLGNLNAVRDWGHAKDYVEGIWRILQYSKPEDWVLATGETLSVRDFASKVFEYLGMPIVFQNDGLEEVAINQRGDVVIEVDPLYFRPTEVPHLQGDFSKAKDLLNWSPTHSIDNLIAEMVDEELSK
jgi:GDPmannose 4,6-dehydratase